MPTRSSWESLWSVWKQPSPAPQDDEPRTLGTLGPKVSSHSSQSGSGHRHFPTETQGFSAVSIMCCSDSSGVSRISLKQFRDLLTHICNTTILNNSFGREKPVVGSPPPKVQPASLPQAASLHLRRVAQKSCSAHFGEVELCWSWLTPVHQHTL